MCLETAAAARSRVVGTLKRQRKKCHTRKKEIEGESATLFLSFSLSTRGSKGDFCLRLPIIKVELCATTQIRTQALKLQSSKSKFSLSQFHSSKKKKYKTEPSLDYLISKTTTSCFVSKLQKRIASRYFAIQGENPYVCAGAQHSGGYFVTDQKTAACPYYP